MKIATYTFAGKRFVGCVARSENAIQAFDLPPDSVASGVLDLVERLAKGANWPEKVGPVLDIADVLLDAPIPRPRRNIWCVGRNYRAHAKELSASVFQSSDTRIDAWPIVFTKVPECVVGPKDDIVMPDGITTQVDYEAELAVVVGKRGKNIAAADALSHVFGYTVVNDVTARDVQVRHGQWDLGKSFDTFCPMGPWIVTSDEFDGGSTRVRCWVNGELRQDASTENMIFDIPTLIETVSRGITLYPGDVIATGTPSGVGMGMIPPSYLSAGDSVRIEIDGLGAIENRCVPPRNGEG